MSLPCVVLVLAVGGDVTLGVIVGLPCVGPLLIVVVLVVVTSIVIHGGGDVSDT